MNIPTLDPLYSRNAHLLYSSQTDYIGPAHHRKKVELFDADEKGNLYRVGKLKVLWLKLANVFTNGKIANGMNKRVMNAITKTIDAINDHLDQLTQLWEKHKNEAKASGEWAQNISQQLYIFPKRPLRVVRVHKESLFLLDLTKSSHVPQNLDPLKDGLKQISLKYHKLEEKIVKIDPNLDLINQPDFKEIQANTLIVKNKRKQLITGKSEEWFNLNLD